MVDVILKRILVISLIIIIISCSKRYAPLKLQQVNYMGNEIRTDGYYFRSISGIRDQNNIDMYFVLFKNGKFIVYGQFIPPYSKKDVESHIDIVAHIPRMFKEGSGIFIVERDSIFVEYWSYAARSIVPTGLFKGKILNDTCININLFNEDATWFFQGYHIKPDSTYAAGVENKQN